MRRGGFVAGGIAAAMLVQSILAEVALADPRSLKPLGWTAEQSRRSKAWTFTSPDGQTTLQVGFYPNSEPAEISEMITRHMKPSYSTVIAEPSAETGPEGVILTGGAYSMRNGGNSAGLAVAVPHKLGGVLGCYGSGAPVSGQAPPALATFINACVEMGLTGTPYNDEQARTAQQRAHIAAAPIASGTEQPVEALVFEVYYISGVGGMVLPDYRPIVLFRDGIACRCLDMPLADIDRSEIQRQRPDDVTRWQKTSSAFVLTWPGNREPTKIAIDVKRPEGLGRDARLDGFWRRLGGGGNTALGGSTQIAASMGYQFNQDGTFSLERTAGASAPGVVTSGKRQEQGRYAIEGDALTLSFADGRTERTSIYRQQDDGRTLWIGGASFVSR